MLPPVVTVDNMRRSDAETIAKRVSSAELMRRAAQGIFNAVKFTGRVAIVCGSGNNGGSPAFCFKTALPRPFSA